MAMGHIVGMSSGFKKSKGYGKRPILVGTFTYANRGAEFEAKLNGTTDPIEPIIESAIEEVNKECLPMMLTINFEEKYCQDFSSMTIPILPTCAEYHKHEGLFPMRYGAIGTPDKIYDLMQDDLQNKRYNLDIQKKIQIEDIKEYIRKNLINYYARVLRNNSSKENLHIVENYQILVQKYDIEKLKNATIENMNMSMLSEKLGDRNIDPFEAIYKFSKLFQTKTANNNDVCFVYGNGTHLIGLKKGRTPEEIEKIAREDAENAKRSFEFEDLDSKMVSSYNTSHTLGDYELIPKQQTTQHVGESQSTQNQPTQSKPSQPGEE